MKRLLKVLDQRMGRRSRAAIMAFAACGAVS